jgi:two-component system, OmpR family, heavy metal sensor histidine kinase CusS
MSSIRQLLTRKLLVGIAVLLACGGLGVYLAARAALLEEFNHTLRARASAISSAVEEHGRRISFEFSEQYIREFDEGVPVNFFQLRRADGTNIKRSRSLGNADLPSHFGTFRRPKIWNLTLPSGFRGRAIGYRFSPREDDRETEGLPAAELTVVMASDRRELDETLAGLALVVVGFGTVLLVGVAVLVPRVLRQEMVPLDQLADQATRINADSLGLRFPTQTLPSELAPISNRLNDLLARLQRAFEREREFSADLAHELRTPIAELRSLAEFGLQWPDDRGDEANSDALAIATQMENIVGQLLALRRSETGQVPIAIERIVLAHFVEDIWQTFTEKAQEKQIQLARAIPDDLAIESDAVLIRSIVTNLIDNAVEYAPLGACMRIECMASAGKFELRVANSVDHLTESDVPRLFERFWRKDPARSNQKHSGLGLSLARAFAQVLGCQLTAALDGSGMLVMTLSGPAALTPSARPELWNHCPSPE